MAPLIRKGAKALPSSGNKPYLSIKADESVMIAPMTDVDEMISVDQHAIWVDGGNSPMFPCIGAGCPGCELGDEPKYRASLAVMTKENGPKIFSFGITVARQLAEIAGELGSIKGKMLKVKRTGSGLGTRYTVVAVGKDVKIEGHPLPDLEASLGPMTREGILKMLIDAGIKPAVADEAAVKEPEAAKAPEKSAGSEEAASSWDEI